MKRDSSDRYRTTELGIVKINNNAITTIASTAALEVKGVSKVGRGIGKTIYEILMRRGGKNGVKVYASENELRLILYITVDYGIDVTRVADDVQENVKTAVEKMTGLVVSAIDVIVEGVKAPQALENRQDRRKI
ncbi:MAG: Asp23/Gls24 family envelope stress response protein [Candidatus Omnitrophota bacterium]|jgi:uncharacterized alkaline shock family protein YloU